MSRSNPIIQLRRVGREASRLSETLSRLRMVKLSEGRKLLGIGAAEFKALFKPIVLGPKTHRYRLEEIEAQLEERKLK